MAYTEGFVKFLRAILIANILASSIFFTFLRPFTLQPVGSTQFFIFMSVSGIVGLLNLFLYFWGISSVSGLREKIGWAIPLVYFIGNFVSFRQLGSDMDKIFIQQAISSVAFYASGAVAIFLIVNAKEVWKFLIAFIALVISDPFLYYVTARTFEMEIDYTLGNILNDLNILVQIAIYTYLWFVADRLSWMESDIEQYPLGEIGI